MKATARQGEMRRFFAILACLALAQCASSGDDGFVVGRSENAFVIIGVAESADNREAHYTMLWRQLDGAGGFTEHDGRTAFEAETNDGSSVRVRGIPGEFALLEVEPGAYALDSVFAVISENRVNYFANGVVQGPERPAFEVRPGEAIYLGIWQMDIDEVTAVARPWRLNEDDLRRVLRESGELGGQEVRVRQTHTRAVLCAPHRLNSRSRREVC
jgi:hypothetical protein